MNNFKTATLASVFALFAGAAYAADVGAKVEVDVIENASGKFEATPSVELTFGNDLGSEFFGGLTVVSVDEDIKLDEWFIGMNIGATTVSFGDQGDLFDFGGLEVVGGETLASPADDHVSVIVSYNGFSGLVGFEDIESDVSEIENVQLSYSTFVRNVDVIAAVDYNLDSEDFTVAVDALAQIDSVWSVGGTLTYADILAYEARGGYVVTETVSAAAFLNGDENDWSQNVGLGVLYVKDGLEAYAEVGYNLDTKEATPAVGVSFSF
jgi:hypothetical protein